MLQRAREIGAEMRNGTFVPVPRDPRIDAIVAEYFAACAAERTPESDDDADETAPPAPPVRAVVHRTVECECGMRVLLSDYHGAHKFSDAHETAMTAQRCLP